MTKKPKRNKIVSWTINIKWDNGIIENISDIQLLREMKNSSERETKHREDVV